DDARPALPGRLPADGLLVDHGDDGPGRRAWQPGLAASVRRMTYAHHTLGEGGWLEGERWMVTLSTSYSGGGPAVLVLPGVAADGWQFADLPDYRRDLEALAAAGCVVFTSTFADVPGGDGGSSWGNQYGRDAMDLALVHLASEYEADTSRLAIVASSEGGVLGLNWAWRHPDAFQALVAKLTPPDVQALYDVNGIVAFTVEAAFDEYGGWAANQPTHDPAANTELVAPIAHKVRMYYSTNDGLA